MKASRRVLWVGVFLAAALAARGASACSVPVFRYALERWPAAPYELLVFHQGPLGEDALKIFDWLRDCAEGMDVSSNVDPRSIDLDGPADAGLLELWKKQAAAKPPWVVLRYPAFHSLAEPVWSGPLTAENAKALLDSPARREIAGRILSGQAAVWVLLESGERARDDAAARLVEDELKKMEATLKPSVMLPEDLVEGAEEVPEVKVTFSLLRLSRKDPAETVLAAILSGSQPASGGPPEPVVFPVFGQGRALCALVGKEINTRNLADIGGFLVGPCSCIVKDQNPGVDLLMSVDWGALPEGQWVKPPEMPELTGIPDVSDETPTPGDDAPARGSWWHTALLGAGGEHRLLSSGVAAAVLLVVLAAVAATVVIRRRRRAQED